ncbi:MAG: Wzz/FepE/Etk N-terminal domain-containing protein [Gammaproteobacteria bacterium]
MIKSLGIDMVSSSKVSRSATSNQELAQICREREIDLIALIYIFVRRRWLFLFGLGLAITIASSVAFLQQPMYESRASIVVGRIGGVQLESPVTLAAELRMRYGISERGADSGILPRLVSATSDPLSGMVTVTAIGVTPPSVKKFLEGVLVDVVGKRRPQYDLGMQRLEVRKLWTQKLVRRLEKSFGKEDTDKDAKLSGGADDSQLSLSRAVVALALISLKKQLTDLDRNTEKTQSEPTHVAVGPTLDPQPVSPQPELDLFIGVVGGVLFGIMLVVGAELSSRVRCRLREEKLRRDSAAH